MENMEIVEKVKYKRIFEVEMRFGHAPARIHFKVARLFTMQPYGEYTFVETKQPCDRDLGYGFRINRACSCCKLIYKKKRNNPRVRCSINFKKNEKLMMMAINIELILSLSSSQDYIYIGDGK
jgi:hypothetical protein